MSVAKFDGLWPGRTIRTEKFSKTPWLRQCSSRHTISNGLPGQALQPTDAEGPQPAVQRLSDDELRAQIRQGLRGDYMPETQATELLAFCKEKLPCAERITTGRFRQKSKQAPKVFCADKDGDGWFPQYQFANMAKEDYNKLMSPIAGTPLQPLLQKLSADFGVDVNHVAINCYPRLDAYIPSHKDSK